LLQFCPDWQGITRAFAVKKDLAMRAQIAFTLIFLGCFSSAQAADSVQKGLPAVASGWSIELAAQVPEVVFPTAIVAAPDGTLYVGSNPMDMTGPPTAPIDRVLAIKDGKSSVIAENLWCVMGLEWVDGTLYVVHAPFLSALRDTDGDGKADERVDLMTGLGPKLPGANGLNDHVASGIRLGMDGFLYIAVGGKGVPRGVGKDGRSIQLQGGGVIRIRPDGTGLEVVSTGENNPRGVALSATDEIFTFGTDDDSKKWSNSLTHHIVGGHYGYPYQFLTSPNRALPVMAGMKGGAGAQGVCYNEDGLAPEFRGNLFLCDWGAQNVTRFELRKTGGTNAVSTRSLLVSKGDSPSFRPFSLAVSHDGCSFWLVDWAYDGFLAPGVRTGRLFHLLPGEKLRTAPAPRPTGQVLAQRIEALDHPALSARMESQRILIRAGQVAVQPLIARLKIAEPEMGRLHSLWALDSIGGPEARRAIADVMRDPSPRVRLQAARSTGIRQDNTATPALLQGLHDRDAAVRRESAIALGKFRDVAAASALYKALGDSDAFASWSVRHAIRRLEAWDKSELVEALLDERRLEPALRLTDEAWSMPVVDALAVAFKRTASAPVRGRIIANIAGLLHKYPDWDGSWYGTNPLARPFPRKTTDWGPQAMKAVLDGLSLGLADADSSVRFQAITGMAQAGSFAPPRLRSALPREPDPTNQAVLIEELGTLKDAVSLPLFVEILGDVRRAQSVRMAALVALSQFRDPASLRARLSLVYAEKAPPALVARALPDLARLGFLPPNDLGSFMENPAPEIRASALLSLNVKKSLPQDLQQSVLDHINDPDESVRQAAILAVVPLQLKAAIPRLLELATKPDSGDHDTAIEALSGLRDPRAASVYLASLEDGNPRVRKLAEAALLDIKDQVPAELISAARSSHHSPSAALVLDRLRARFTPIASWLVIGPFPRVTPRVFMGERSIDFAKSSTGVAGRIITWIGRTGDVRSGRVDLDDRGRADGVADLPSTADGEAAGLGAFGYAEVNVERAGPALLMCGSSGPLMVTLNETTVHEFGGVEGRAYAPDSEVVRANLLKGRNRILVFSRQVPGKWSYSVQVALLPIGKTDEKAAIVSGQKK
jgi:HEAT repeat protein/glucose/arabinose dehydrogenase